jgi:hypothetical protein
MRGDSYRALGHRPRFCDLDDQTIFVLLGLYAKGEKVDYIADRAQCSVQAVSKVAHAHGMRRRRVKGTYIFETIFD